MILFGIIVLFFAVVIFFLIQHLELKRLKNYAEKFILTSVITRNSLHQIELKDSYVENIYWYDFSNNSLYSASQISRIKDSNELNFLILKYFVDYISSSQSRMRTFMNGASAYLFAPIHIENETKYLVFEKTMNTIETLITKK